MKLNLLNQFSRYHTVVAKVQPDVFGWRPILFLLALRLWLNYSTCWINRHFSWWGINLRQTDVFDVVKILNFPSSTGHLLEKTMKSLHFKRFFSFFSPKSRFGTGRWSPRSIASPSWFLPAVAAMCCAWSRRIIWSWILPCRRTSKPSMWPLGHGIWLLDLILGPSHLSL